jgi:hypothetical protein
MKEITSHQRSLPTSLSNLRKCLSSFRKHCFSFLREAILLRVYWMFPLQASRESVASSQQFSHFARHLFSAKPPTYLIFQLSVARLT